MIFLELFLNYNHESIMSGIIIGFITIVFNVICHNDLAKEGQIKPKIFQLQ